MIREQILPPHIQAMVDAVNAEKLILAEVLLPQIDDMPEYDQYFRVEDMNIALSGKYLKLIPTRVLVHKVSKYELNLNLPVPNWEKLAIDITALIDDETGNRILVPATYSEYITPEPTEENPNPEPVLTVIETKDEPVLVPTLQYLLFIIKNKKLLEAIELFTIQFIEDEQLVNPDVFKTLPKK